MTEEQMRAAFEKMYINNTNPYDTSELEYDDDEDCKRFYQIYAKARL